MPKTVAGVELTPDERAVAHALWGALMFPATHAALTAARQQLIEAPTPIQQALINAIAEGIRQHREPQHDQNPFA